MRRTQGAEARLHNRYTLGVGGHINPEDVGHNPVLDGLRRELLAARTSPRWWRWINWRAIWLAWKKSDRCMRGSRAGRRWWQTG